MIGIGTGPIFEASEQTAAATFTYAYEHGVNCLDFATAGAKTFPYAGAALHSVRKELFCQVHFGANYETGEYGWTTELDTVKRQVDWQLNALNTTYIDFGMIHCLDEPSDWKKYQENGILDYLLELKRAGVVRHTGLINKYYDLAVIGDAMAADHDTKLGKHASDCIRCGHCDGRCPFHVVQTERMQAISRYFGQ